MHPSRPTCRHDQAVVRRVRERRDSLLNFRRVAHIDQAYFHPERRRRGLNDTELGGAAGGGGIAKDARSYHSWRDLGNSIFPSHAVFEQEETRGVAARPSQAVNEAGGDRIGDAWKHDRHGAGRL